MFFETMQETIQQAIQSSIILCMSIPSFFGVFGFFAFLRYLRHKETMMMVEKGLLHREDLAPVSSSDRTLINRGILLIAIGFALCLGLLPIGFFVQRNGESMLFGPWLIVGLLPLFIGLAIVIQALLPTLQSLGLPNKVNRGQLARSIESTGPSAQGDDQVQ